MAHADMLKLNRIPQIIAENMAEWLLCNYPDCTVLPILWMTSSFHIMGHIACGTGKIDVGAVLQQVVTKLPSILDRWQFCS